MARSGMRGTRDRDQMNVVMEEHMEPEYEPTEKEIEDYAEWLGMDLEEDRELFWIARAGLKAPLPAPWKPCQSGDHEIFYFNFETHESVWDHPCDEHYRQLYLETKAKRNARLAAEGSLSAKKDNKGPEGQQ